MDRATRKRFYNLCDPAEPLAAGEERYADVDALGVRGASWTDEVACRIELSDRPVCELVTAAPGAGVTTEMRRLAARLGRDAKLLPVHIDAESVLDLWSPIDTAGLLLAILEQTERAVAEAAGEPSAFEKMRSRVNADRSRFLAEVRDELTLLNHGARRLGRSGIVVLFDGLEKLAGNTVTWASVLGSAEQVFQRGAPALSLPVHVIYTLPLALLVRLEAKVRVLPMIALANREERRQDAGFRAAQEIIERRVPSRVLDELFGPEHRAARIEQLIASSGGSPREIVRLLQSSIAQSSLDGPSFTRLLSMETDSYRRAVTDQEASWLASVHRSKELGAAPRDVAEAMLARGVVLPYRNGDAWFDLHPAVLGAIVAGT